MLLNIEQQLSSITVTFIKIVRVPSLRPHSPEAPAEDHPLVSSYRLAASGLPAPQVSTKADLQPTIQVTSPQRHQRVLALPLSRPKMRPFLTPRAVPRGPLKQDKTLRPQFECQTYTLHELTPTEKQEFSQALVPIGDADLPSIATAADMIPDQTEKEARARINSNIYHTIFKLDETQLTTPTRPARPISQPNPRPPIKLFQSLNKKEGRVMFNLYRTTTNPSDQDNAQQNVGTSSEEDAIRDDKNDLRAPLGVQGRKFSINVHIPKMEDTETDNWNNEGDRHLSCNWIQYHALQ